MNSNSGIKFNADDLGKKKKSKIIFEIEWNCEHDFVVIIRALATFTNFKHGIIHLDFGLQLLSLS